MRTWDKTNSPFSEIIFFLFIFFILKGLFLRWTLIGQSCYIYEIYILYLIFEYIAYCHEDWVFDRIFKRKIIHMFLLCFEIKFHILSIQQKLRKIFFIWHFKLNNMPAFYLTNWGSEGQHLVWVVRNLQVDIGHILLQLHTVESVECILSVLRLIKTDHNHLSSIDFPSYDLTSRLIHDWYLH